MDELIKNLIAIRDSDKLTDRQFYAQAVKDIIAMFQGARLDGEDKENLKQLKIHLSNYDVYKQKIICQTCKENPCICDDAFTSYQGVRQEIPKEHGVGSALRGKDLEEIPGTIRGDSSDPGSKEDLELPF